MDAGDEAAAEKGYAERFGMEGSGSIIPSRRRRTPSEQRQIGRAREVADVFVPGHEWRELIQAALRDEGVGEAGLAPPAQHRGAKNAGALPVPGSIEAAAAP